MGKDEQGLPVCNTLSKSLLIALCFQNPGNKMMEKRASQNAHETITMCSLGKITFPYLSFPISKMGIMKDSFLLASKRRLNELCSESTLDSAKKYMYL